ncbi:MAG: hypothetical protein Q8M16_11990 [Pirellulaceae bacterium]|nr:hypothetical protein [Pirellulaceae bacterium]
MKSQGAQAKKRLRRTAELHRKAQQSDPGELTNPNFSFFPVERCLSLVGFNVPLVHSEKLDASFLLE